MSLERLARLQRIYRVPDLRVRAAVPVAALRHVVSCLATFQALRMWLSMTTPLSQTLLHHHALLACPLEPAQALL